jgi:type II secretory pathway pseudopilin PulG
MRRLGFGRIGIPLGARARGRVRAFSLVEVVVALGVVTFCLLSLIGLASVGLNSNKLVREQIIALDLCRQIESDLKATGATNTISPLYGIAIPAAGASVTTTLYDTYPSSTTSFGPAQAANSQYRFTVVLNGPATTSPNDPVNANIQATWPPGTTPRAPLLGTPTNVIGTINLDVAVNRNGS